MDAAPSGERTGDRDPKESSLSYFRKVQSQEFRYLRRRRRGAREGNVGFLGLLVELAEQEAMESLRLSREPYGPCVLGIFQEPKRKHLIFTRVS